MLNWFPLRCPAILAIFFCLLSVLPGFAAAPEQPVIDLLGTTTLTIPPGETGKEDVNLEVPVRLLKPASGITLQPVSATLEPGKSINPSAFTFEFESQGDRGLGTIKIKINRQQTDKTGDYNVTVMAWLPQDQPPPSPPDGKTPQVPAFKAESPKLTFKFIKPAAKLQLTPKKFERVIFLPWVCSRLYPGTLLLSETGGDSRITPYDTDWRGDLSLADGQALPGRLLVSDLQPIDPWKQKVAKITLEGTLPIGTARGTITIRAPQLATNQTDFAVDVVSRVTLIWLLLFLGGSIFAGWFFREYVEKRTERDNAEVAAEEQRALLVGLLDKTVDPDCKQRLQAVLNDLVAAMGQTPGKPEELTKAADKTRQETLEILKDMNTRRGNAEKEITKMLSYLTPEQAPEVNQERMQVIEWLQAQQSDLQAGFLKRVEEALKQEKENPERLTPIRRSLKIWIETVNASLAKVRPWPDIYLDQKLTAYKDQKIKLTENQIEDVNDFEKLGNLLRTTNDIWWQLTNDLFKRRNEAIRLQATAILQNLKKLYPDPGVLPLDGLEKAVRQYGDLSQDKEAPENLSVLVEAEGRLWDSLKGSLKKACQVDQIDAAAELDAGAFSAALEQIKRKRGEQESPETKELLQQLESIPAGVSEELLKEVPQSVSEAWLISIKKPAEAVAEERVTVELVVSPREQSVKVRWSVVGVPSLHKEGASGDLVWEFIPPGPGTLVVQAEAESPDGRKQTKQESLVVMPLRVAELKKRIRKAERNQTIISGLIITYIGYAIFRVSFTGTFDDFLAVGLWGFTIDFGIGKVREYAAPYLALKPKVPAGK